MTDNAHEKSDVASVDQHFSWIDAACREFEAVKSQSGPSTDLRHPQAGNDDHIAKVLTEALPGYEIQQECQRGGQGVVFRSTQIGTGRDVAIKVLHETSATKARDRARFEREVKILGQLRHPNIVKIIDSGSTDGRFYYIMDFVNGLPLDDYVLNNDLSIRDALALFVKVCDAVEVAHLRGIIHRDIKPSNIRVDQGGEPHVMDFGLAKVDEFDAIADPRTEVQTVAGQFVGTLPWASPEQLETAADDLDIRTDVYSLGVVLYQILARSFPYELGGSVRQAIDNICSVDPAKPSSINPQIDDDLDCIVLKALRKGRDDRYQSAGNLAREIRRYLAGEPIEAKRDNGWYVLRKTIRRHRVKAAFTGLAGLLVVLSLITLNYKFRQESRLRAEAEQARDEAATARDEAERAERIAQEVNAFLNYGVLASARPDAMGKDVTVREALTAASEDIEQYFPGEPEMQARIRYVVGNTYFELGEPDEAVQNLTKALEQFRQTLGADHPDTLHAMNDLARVYEGVGRYEEARSVFEKCLDARTRVLGEHHPETIITLANLGWAGFQMGDKEMAEELCRRAVNAWKQAPGDHEEQARLATNLLATVLVERRKFAEAKPMLIENYQWHRKNLGEDHPTTLITMANLASLYKDMGDYDHAEPLYVQVLDARKRILGTDHPSTILGMNNLAVLYSVRGENDQAAVVFEEAIDAGQSALGESHPTMISMVSNLGKSYYRMGQYEKAKSLQQKALDSARRYLPEDHAYVGLYMTRLAGVLSKTNQHEQAEKLFDEAYELLVKSAGPSDTLTVNLIEYAVEHYESRDMVAKAESWKQRLPSSG